MTSQTESIILLTVTTVKNDSTRERIIEAATQLFAREGYTATGMARILKRAKASSGSFYYSFKSKEGLLLAVIDRHIEELAPALTEPDSGKEEEDAIERIFSLLARYRKLIVASGCTFACPVGRLVLEVSPGQGKVRQKLAAYFEAWRWAVEKCLEDASERLPKDLDLGKLAALVLSVVEGGVMQARAASSVKPSDHSVKQLRDYLDRLLEEGAEKKQK